MTHANTFEVHTISAGETARLGSALSPLLLPGDMVVLAGDLGAGKTTFVQGLAAGLGITEPVTSPSYVLLKEYTGGRYPLMHMDVYRLDRIQDVIDLGYDEFLDPSYILAVEWGDMVEPLLPKDHLHIELRYEDDTSRRISLSPIGGVWESRMPTIEMLASELFWAGREGDPGDPQTGRL